MFDDFGNVLYFNHSVKSIFGINLYERSLRAETETTHLIDGNFVAEILFGNNLFELGFDFRRMRGKTARAAAKNDMSFTVRTRELGVHTFGTFCDRRVQFVKILYLFHNPPPIALYSAITPGTASTVIFG